MTDRLSDERLADIREWADEQGLTAEGHPAAALLGEVDALKAELSDARPDWHIANARRREAELLREAAEAEVARLSGENARLREALEHIAGLPDISASSHRRAEVLARAALSAVPSAGRHLTAEDAEQIVEVLRAVQGEQIGSVLTKAIDNIIALLAPAPATDAKDAT